MDTKNAALAREPRDARNHLSVGQLLRQRPAGIVAAFCIVLALVIWGSIAVQLKAERANAVSHAMHET
ncbi:MAG TPA: hypothetical protein VNT02_09540, partial [Burkholderiales bacterium]|nr:hypothetical protein [Burkholderiales bacterium]